MRRGTQRCPAAGVLQQTYRVRMGAAISAKWGVNTTAEFLGILIERLMLY
jgi:hypothetical protein